MKRLQFSVVIPTLNEEKFLPPLLSSLTKQTQNEFEVIVVDGSSKDRTVALAKTFSHKLPRLKVIISKKASLPLQRNLGAKEAKGEWLVFVDADGIFLPFFIERCASFIAEQKPSVFAVWLRPDSEVAGDALITLLANIAFEVSVVFRRQLTPGQLTIISREAFAAVGGYDEARTFNEDLDLGLRLAKAGYKLSILRETLCTYSLRRYRREGTLRVFQQYTKAAVAAFLTRKAPRFMPGYIMGGHLYGRKRRKVARSVLRVYERKLRQLVKELFG